MLLTILSSIINIIGGTLYIHGHLRKMRIFSFSNKIYIHMNSRNYEENGNDFHVGFANHLVEIQVQGSQCT